MPVNILPLPSQAIVPLGNVLIYVALFLYPLLRRKFHDTAGMLFASFLFVSLLWNINLIAAAANVPSIIPGLTWTQLASYGLVVLSMVYWSFAHAFLKLQWTQLWGWGIGTVGLALAIVLDTGLLNLPPQSFSWSSGWITGQNIGFILCAILWAFLTLFTLIMAQILHKHTDNPAHKNRLQYLIISILLLAVGYGMYLSLREPFWTIGLIGACLGSILTTYLVTVEDLADLGTGTRYVIRNSFMTLVSIAVYVAGIYLANIIINDYLDTTISSFINPTLLVAIITAIILTMVYTPIRRVSVKLANRLFLGQGYDSQTVIQNYTQTISNLLYLNELSTAILLQLDQAPGVKKGALFIVDTETEGQFNLRSVLPRVLLCIVVISIFLATIFSQ